MFRTVNGSQSDKLIMRFGDLKFDIEGETNKGKSKTRGDRSKTGEVIKVGTDKLIAFSDKFGFKSSQS
jgi:hypothetical protein